MITLRDRTTRAWAYTERKACQGRLQRLALRLRDLDPREDRLDIVDAKVAMRAVFDTMERCDAILAPLPDPVLPPIPTATEAATTMRHARARAVLHMIESCEGLPPACHEAARSLRRTLIRELTGKASVGHRR
jgi:hypothetical protein